MLDVQDTIAAIATALGEASVGIVRVSGPSAAMIASEMFRSPLGQLCQFPAHKAMFYGYLVNPLLKVQLDEAVLLWMPGPRSYTAEDVVEFQVHGGIRIVQDVLEAALQSGARLAEPGEFTKRAFLNGRIDLSQAEAVIDLIRAKTDLASRSALNQVKGRLSDVIREMRKQLISLQAHVEVTIDYPEHDVESVACAQVVEVGGTLVAKLDELIANARVGQILREGVFTTIAGRPNVGKSSLLNALLRRDRAIVTDIPGTTRDALEEYVNVRGIPFRLVDTAGIRDTVDVVERIGVEKSREMVSAAELILLVFNQHEGITDEDRVLLAQTAGLPRLLVLNKSDLDSNMNTDELNEVADHDVIVSICAKSANGLGALEQAMEEMVLDGQVTSVDASYLTNARQGSLLREARSDLQLAVDAAKAGATLDIVAVQLQAAYASLGLVIGEEAGEDLLDEIFSKFCLGK
jgi:tRNA modification GTPase